MKAELDRMLEEGSISIADAGAVQDFARFLSVIEPEGSLRYPERLFRVPADWVPYVLGQGDAPDE